jgi:hypothetical protein
VEFAKFKSNLDVFGILGSKSADGFFHIEASPVGWASCSSFYHLDTSSKVASALSALLVFATLSSVSFDRLSGLGVAGICSAVTRWRLVMVILVVCFLGGSNWF